jgi:hypothetical protein
MIHMMKILSHLPLQTTTLFLKQNSDWVFATQEPGGHSGTRYSWEPENVDSYKDKSSELASFSTLTSLHDANQFVALSPLLPYCIAALY